jgi:hypothetical protein
VKFSSSICGFAAAAAVICAFGSAQAANLLSILPVEGRVAEGGRSVQVVVAQSELKSNINPSDIVVATGGGLLGALIDAEINNQRAKKAELVIQPLRAALVGLDVDALALETTKAGLGTLDWFQPTTVAFSRDNTVPAKVALLDASATNQVAFVEYVYDTSPDFSSIRVSVTIQLANKALAAGAKPDSRLRPRALAYANTVTSVVTRPRRPTTTGPAGRPTTAGCCARPWQTPLKRTPP